MSFIISREGEGNGEILVSEAAENAADGVSGAGYCRL